MSLPLPRRIAQAALLLGAAAAPLVGAGAAQAAPLPQQDLGGLTAVDGAGLGSTVNGATQHRATLAAKTGSDAVKTALPTAGRLVGTTSRAAAPATQQAAGDATDVAGRVAGATTESATGAIPAARTLPAALPNARTLPANLPTTGLPTGRLPLSGIPLG
ncbi:ATP-binding protein [Streptomyces sp.]|uniref:ATP-binding protein n=1 Tax=Streptomyces sp. TaxID=1931 RepID=UPI002F3EBAEF